ncbi:MAG: hypothetical protein M1834_000163 [Cirrosporium novae-zelandiae]|nr:MAG: hypothetical protein M1834_000163 [Cirrosporium novae-zelandiae]
MPSFEGSANSEDYPSTRKASTKSVLIAEPESSPLISESPTPIEKNNDTASLPRKHWANVGKRLSGRPPISPSLQSVSTLDIRGDDDDINPNDALQLNLLSKVAEWLKEEKKKKVTHKLSSDPTQEITPSAPKEVDGTGESMALDKLERILAEAATLLPHNSDGPHFHRRRLRKRPSSGTLLKRGSTTVSSDTDYQDGDVLIPSAEVVLDNTKTLSYVGGNSESILDVNGLTKRVTKENENWKSFKFEIVRLAHTLKLKGWRRIPMEQAEEIDVERLSGALTNAVYVVSPPRNLSPVKMGNGETAALISPKKPPPKLLLRVYGPQAEHLIDRDNELQILRRLGRKKIGPRLLGTFTNGRFEEFLHARTLTAQDLRVPEISRHIAKRMRELHDGIELLPEERHAGPHVWRNWDKWVNRCEQIMSWLDQEILSQKPGNFSPRAEAWRSRGLVCGVEWPLFRQVVERYRKWLEGQYGGLEVIKDRLVFAHSDTQYGNLMRLQPSGESPLLLPANEHKQLVVIDFEYASANMAALEFANHFTEWCYNYHDADCSYACHEKRYPTPEEQKRFLQAYVKHQSQLPQRFSLPFQPGEGPSPSLSAFMLDSRTPASQQIEAEEKEEEVVEQDVEQFAKETRLWRVVNSAHWVAWGVVQAKTGGIDEALQNNNASLETDDQKVVVNGKQNEAAVIPDPLQGKHKEIVENHNNGSGELAMEAAAEGEEGEEEFDYLGYAQERAMFFWGDVLSLGIVKEDELPSDLLPKLKMVPY